MSVQLVPSKIIILSLIVLTVVNDIPVGATTLCACWNHIGVELAADASLIYDVHLVGSLR